MRVALVEAGLKPTDGVSIAYRTWTATDGRFLCPTVGLYLLAARVPKDIQVEVWDEKVQGPYPTDRQVDLVGISYKSMNAQRAYALADELMESGKRVVLGGVHASLLPDEAAAHADTVVIGEADDIWTPLVMRAEAGTFLPLIRADQRPTIRHLPPQRVDLVNQESYLMHAVQTARGCSLDCEFCPTRHMFGEGFRLRSVRGVIEEVRQLLHKEDKPLFFVDDIFGAGQMDYLEELTRKLRTLSVRFGVISDVQVLGPEMIQLLSRGGCVLVCLNMPGTCTEDERACIRSIRQAGMHVWGYFMFGFEEHTPEVFDRCVDFVRDTGMDGVFLTVMAPLHGTPMAKRLTDEGRIISRDWQQYDQTQVVIQPRGMTVSQLEQGYCWIREQLEDCWGVPQIWSKLTERFG